MISAAELTSLATTHDIISVGMLADDVRRARHGAVTTFVRVATVSADVGAPVNRPASAGELRIVGQPVSRVGRMFADSKYHNYDLYDWVHGHALWKVIVIRRPADDGGE